MSSEGLIRLKNSLRRWAAHMTGHLVLVAGRGIDSGQGVEELSLFALGLMEVSQERKMWVCSFGVLCFLLAGWERIDC